MQPTVDNKNEEGKKRLKCILTIITIIPLVLGLWIYLEELRSGGASFSDIIYVFSPYFLPVYAFILNIPHISEFGDRGIFDTYVFLYISIIVFALFTQKILKKEGIYPTTPYT